MLIHSYEKAIQLCNNQSLYAATGYIIKYQASNKEFIFVQSSYILAVNLCLGQTNLYYI